jgi:ParB/RepB/Spo0J family partition protein
MSAKKRGGLVGAMLTGDLGDIDFADTKSNLSQNVTPQIDHSVRTSNVNISAESRPGERIKEIDPSKCRLWKFADRPEDEATHADDLAKSFTEMEQIAPVIVRTIDHSDADYPEIEYEVIAGSVRWRAAIKSGKLLKAFIRNLDDKQALNVMLAENELRKQISEFARALQVMNIWESGLFESKQEAAQAHKMELSRFSMYLKVASKASELQSNFGSDVKTIGLRSLYEFAGEIGKGSIVSKNNDSSDKRYAGKPTITSFTVNVSKTGITTIKFPKLISEEKLSQVRAILESD